MALKNVSAKTEKLVYIYGGGRKIAGQMKCN